MDLRDRLAVLEEQHLHQHKLVEAAEAEKCPEKYVQDLKKKKLALKDEIAKIKSELGIQDE